jgi:hypothetical protein
VLSDAAQDRKYVFLRGRPEQSRGIFNCARPPDDARSRAREALERLADTQRVHFFPFTLQHCVAIGVLSPHDADERAARYCSAARLLGYVNAQVAELRALREFTEQQEYDRIMGVLAGDSPAEPYPALMEAGAAMAHRPRSN